MTGCPWSVYERPRLLFFRAFAFCFFPGGPSGLPCAVVLLPGFFSFAMPGDYGLPAHPSDSSHSCS